MSDAYLSKKIAAADMEALTVSLAATAVLKGRINVVL